MKKGNTLLRIISLMTLLCICCLAFTSCLVMDGFGHVSSDDDDYMSRAEVEELLEQQMGENVTIEGGDNYNITIDGTANNSLAAAAKALLSAVQVECGFSTRSGIAVSNGSGVIYKLDKSKGDAYIITNFHVVYYSSSTTSNGISDDIKLYLYGQEDPAYAIPATYVGGSEYYDIAVLKVKGSRVLSESNAQAATFADSDKVSVLDTAIAVGNPEGEGISATVGYVNMDSEEITLTSSRNNGTYFNLRVMRIDAAVNGGNSGGGLFNANGEVIGIVNAKMSSDLVENIGYAIPSNLARYAAENIIYYCDGKDCETVLRCIIGVTVTVDEYYTVYDTETGKIHKMETVAIASVTDGELADGKLQAGDIIRSVTIDGVTYDVTRTFHVIENMINARVGSTVITNITRNGVDMSVTLNITESTLTPW